MTRVYINPTYTKADNGDGGIRRVSEALRQYLPGFDVTPVDSPDDADVINNHGASLVSRPGVPEVASCHGLYWSNYDWAAWAHEANSQVTAVLSRAVAHTAPSRWVAEAMTRGMFVYPEVIYHGIDTDDWKPGVNGGYVLWNKARADLVSNPGDMNAAASLLPKTVFVSTFGEATKNVKIIGRTALPAMHEWVANAGVYLATARETFGIGTLEALACGVPVVGWNWGGQSEIIIPGETGYLVPPGDYEALATAIVAALAERARLGDAARIDAIRRWAWKPRIGQYAEIFKRVAAGRSRQGPRVSVVVTCHNLARFLPDALSSLQAQTVRDWECLIVDDASADNTPAVGIEWQARDPRFRYLRTPENLKLPGALNYGWRHATGRYVLNLDADNVLDPRALETLAAALDADPAIHIAYGHMDVADVELKKRRRNEWPPVSFDWRSQMGHLNQIPSTAMVRREVYERTGGYRRRMWRAEDAEFWCRATSFGFRAKKVTELSVFTYRDRPDSKSKGEGGDGNWTAWFPWGFASTGRDGLAQIKANRGPRIEAVPWGAQATPPPPLRFWAVPDHTTPSVSVIIPVGPGHAGLVIDALDSLVAQTFRDWEAIVVYDDESAPDTVAGAPYARVLHTEGRQGPGVARNAGAKIARGEVLYFLDADDYLLPQTLEKMWKAYKASGYLIYGDWLRNDSDGKDMGIYEADDFECGAALKQMQHSVNVMVPRAYHEKIGGFDERMSGWEDWDYCIALQDAGLCSERLPEPLFVYRFRAGGRRENSFGEGDSLKGYIRQKWAKYYEGGEKMGCGCSGKKKIDAPTPATALVRATVEGNGNAVLLEYRGAQAGPLVFRGPESEKIYRFGLDERHKFKWVLKADAEAFLARTVRGVPVFVLVPPPPSETPPTPAASTPEFVGAPPAVVVEQPPPAVVVTAEPPVSVVLPVNGHGENGSAEAAPEVVRESVIALTTKTLEERIAAGATREDLMAWRLEEVLREKPRRAVVRRLNQALSEVVPA